MIMGALTKDAEIMESLKKLRPTKKRKTKTQAGTPSKELPAQPGPGSLICSKCGSPYVVHNGQTTAGKDRVKCADCGKSWLAPPATSTTNSPPIPSWSPGPLPFLPWMTPTQASAADDATNAQLNDLQAALSKLSKKALQKLNNLLDDPNARVQMQAALGTIRSTFQALTRDTSSQGGGAEIHIHCSSQAAVVSPSSPGAAGQAPNPHDGMTKPKGIGHPIAIVK